MLIEHSVLSSSDAFAAMAACRSVGGFRIVDGLPQGFHEYESAFVLDPRHPTCNGREHYSNPKGCHLYCGNDGCWVLNRRFAPEKPMEMRGYLRTAEADKAKLLHGVSGWSPTFKRPLVWRWRVADTYHDVTLAFRYEAVVPSAVRRPRPQPQEARTWGGPEAALRTSLYEESMALTRQPTGRAGWQDHALAAPTPAVASNATHKPRQRNRHLQSGTARGVLPQAPQPHRLKAGGMAKPRKGRTDGPRGREAVLIRRT